MDLDLIIKVLQSSCSNENLRFQVIIKNSQLHIYLNRKPGYEPDYESLTEQITQAIASLNFDSLVSIWLYSRLLGEIEPDWQVFVEFPLDIDEEEDTSSDVVTFDQTEEVNVESYGDDSLGDTGLLQNAGMVHGKPLEEAEIETFIDDKKLESVDRESAVETNSLVQYCFVSNKKILTGDIILPGKEVVRLVKFFHHLSQSNKDKVLPVLETYFQSKKMPDTEDLAIALKKWLKQIAKLNPENRRQLAIWLSRYCFNSSGTLDEFEAQVQKQAEKAEAAKKNKRSNTEYNFTPANIPTPVTSVKDLSSQEFTAPKFQVPPQVKQSLIPLIWTFFTIILIGLGVYTSRAEKSSFSRSPSLCQTTIGSSDYCRLGVNLAGEAAIKESAKSIFPLSDITKTVADYGCQRYANVKAEAWNDLEPKNNPVVSSYGEKIFPNVYVVEAAQKKVKESGQVRVACVYTTGPGERSPTKLANDVIPNDWPSQYYRSGNKSNLAFGIYTNPINLALYTMFGAVGMAIASKFDLGIVVTQRPETIYLLALILGIVQLIAVNLPGLNLIASIALPVLAILAASRLIRNFKLNWNYSYLLIASGILVVIAVQFLLYGITIKLINSLA